jgi:hypothetical protein
VLPGKVLGLGEAEGGFWAIVQGEEMQNTRTTAVVAISRNFIMTPSNRRESAEMI